jgi:hypothetical protein
MFLIPIIKEKTVGLFGPSKIEKFIQNNALSLAIYLKNNSLKFGIRVYEECYNKDVFEDKHDDETIWYFSNLIYAFRIANDSIDFRGKIGKDFFAAMWMKFIDIDKEFFNFKEKEDYKDTFKLVGIAADVIDEFKLSAIENSMAFMMIAIKDMPYEFSTEDKANISFIFAKNSLGFPPLSHIIKENV